MLNSKSYRLRKLTCAEAELIEIGRLSSRLSLITAVSLKNAELGALSGLVVAMAHGGGGPSAIDSVHPGGRVDWPSKFSRHGPDGLGLGLATGLGLGLAPGEGDGGGVPPGVAVGIGDGVGEIPGVGVGNGVPSPRSYTSTNPLPVPLFNPASSTGVEVRRQRRRYRRFEVVARRQTRRRNNPPLAPDYPASRYW